METKTRKLVSRVGAAFMLGLSLFNMGTAINKSQGQELPKRSKMIRKREVEELKPEAQLIANIAEEEAKDVMTEEQGARFEAVAQTQALTGSQKIIRVAAVAVWSLAAGVFFTSMVFNFPFALGKGVLAVLPGGYHGAVLKLQPEKGYYDVGEDVKIWLKLDTDNEAMNSLVATLRYNVDGLEFQRYELSGEPFSTVQLDSIAAGTLRLTLDRGTLSSKYDNDVLCVLHFISKEKTGSQEVEIVQKDSRVFKTAKEKKVNILGKVQEAKIQINQPLKTKVNCDRMAFSPDQEDAQAQWQTLAKGAILPGETSRWISLKEDAAFSCAYYQTKVYYLFLNFGGEQDGKVVLGEKEVLLGGKFPVASWTDEDAKISVYEIGEAPNQTGVASTIIFKGESGERLKWPERGTGELVFN